MGGPGDDAAASPAADAGASCVHRSDGAIGCHGDDDESDQLQRRTDEESAGPLTQLPQQQSATGGYSPSHNFLFSVTRRRCLCVSLYVSMYVRGCRCNGRWLLTTRAVHNNEVT